MDRFVNLNLLRNPYNWAVVVLMVLVGSLAVRYLALSFAQPANDGDPS